MPQPPMNTPQSFDHRELEARAQDLVSVANPLSEDYYVYWDSRPFRVGASGNTTLPRYIAANYLEKMATKLIMDKADAAVKAENDKRVSQLQQKEMDAIETRNFSRRMMPDVLVDEKATIMRQLFKGTVSRYGEGSPPINPELSHPIQSIDAFSLMNEVEKKTPFQTPPVPSNPSESAIEDML